MRAERENGGQRLGEIGVEVATRSMKYLYQQQTHEMLMFSQVQPTNMGPKDKYRERTREEHYCLKRADLA